ncbi:MAG: NADH-quinone oxidoreductase subunit [Actinomycetota bacterium]|nr:NADH-quinone oxidoreductase subunit [Actinomycetota bacterium]
MLDQPRVLDAPAVADLDSYRAIGGGKGLEAARRLGVAGVIDEVDASGLRGRGGAGFPTGRKWRTVASYETPDVPAIVAVNAAEGEPGSFKDRAIIRANAYRVVEGALIAACAVRADRVVIATKASFTREIERLRAAVGEIVAAGWAEGVDVSVLAGPSAYLYGEETALLEVIDGREPFPRVAPPWRRGVDDVPLHPGGAVEWSAAVEMATTGGDDLVAPALVDNVETVANLPGILAQGADWFRELGTTESPGSVVCTISGRSRRAGVAEIAMGTSLAQAIESVGGGARPGRQLVAAVSGVANAFIPAANFDTPLTYEAMRDIGSGLGACGFIVFDDQSDLVAVAHAVARFLAVESCGQCTPCKQDGLAISAALERVRGSHGDEHDLDVVAERLRTVADGARCALATQQQAVVGSALRLFPEPFRAHADAALPAAAQEVIAEIVDIADGIAVLDERHLDKQPDWSYDAIDSGQAPADRL